jgi:hypothetical protein
METEIEEPQPQMGLTFEMVWAAIVETNREIKAMYRKVLPRRRGNCMGTACRTHTTRARGNDSGRFACEQGSARAARFFVGSIMP